jgi:hypothetical protein
MGSIGGGSSKQSSRSKESKLSKEQASILKRREEQYQAFFFPRISAEIGATAGDGMTNELAQTGLANVNRAYHGAKRDIARNVAQREVSGGMGELIRAKADIARADASTDVVNSAFRENKQMRHGLLAMAAQGMPQPTQAAPFHQRSKGSSWNARGSFMT